MTWFLSGQTLRSVKGENFLAHVYKKWVWIYILPEMARISM